MKTLRPIGIKILNSFPLGLKWFFFEIPIFRKRLRIDFNLTRKGFLSNKARILIIGANDGLSFDDLFSCLNSHQTSGLLIEPSTKYFNQLLINTEGYPNLKAAKFAVSKSNTLMELFQLNENGLQKMPEWGRGIGSFSKEHLLKFDGVNEEDIETESVEGRTFESIIEAFDLRVVDYLQIDTEGFDAEIIKMIDFNNFLASLIKLEVVNLSNRDFLEVQAILKNQEYYLDCLGEDMVAYSRQINPYFS